MLRKILVAGTNSGVGKTTITMALIAALRGRNLRVQPFKAGPDYIDPTYHTLAAGRPCRNIDTWMVPSDRAEILFNKATQDADIAVIEGVMGIFDGFSYETEEGSTAQIAKLVGATVLLVLDVGKVARSSAAVAQGFVNFDSELNIGGFILNRCGSESHYQGVKLAVEKATALPVLGWLPKDANLHIPERHLGLVPTDERGELTSFVTHAAKLIDQYFDLDQILAISSQISVKTPRYQRLIGGQQSEDHRNPQLLSSSCSLSPTIAVARDAAFSFYYEDNINLLGEAGARIAFFSPLIDPSLPPHTNGIYLGGGFPEMHAAQLAANSSLQKALRQAHTNHIPIYAECGGFMYLTSTIIDLDGREHAMVGLVPGRTRMQPRLMRLGYRLVTSMAGNFLLPKGETTRGHEFHWSSWEDIPESSPAWHIQPRRGSGVSRPDGYAKDNLVASYVHLHFAHNLQLAQNFVSACQKNMTPIQ